ncbi:MAG: cardiolipin synthase [Lachnospiraceae bacterium]|nr:cardiolipin synthase [Lachnospiraceae bacterium]
MEKIKRRKFDKRRAKSHGIIRAGSVLIALTLQVLFIVLLAAYLHDYAWRIYFFIEILSALLVFALVNDTQHNQQFWIVIILALPGFGFILYFFWGSERKNFDINSRIRKTEAEAKKRLPENREVLEELASIHPNKIQIARYLARDGFPVYNDTSVKYYPVGDAMEEEFIKDLRKAEESIFLEYFIIYNGEWWQRIEDVLVEKAREGLDVRLLIDDFGSLFMDVGKMKKELGRSGVQVYSYEPIQKRFASLSFNYRNHQKITVIDSTVGYTGGINLADEYVNKIVRFGHWQDTAVRLEGQAVWTLTNIFFTMWEQCSKKKELVPENYRPKRSPSDTGFVQPFSGGPHRTPYNPVEGAYERMISKARDYIYITTPYLVLDEKMIDQLIGAALSGVDVRIITPRVYDKWYVYMVTVSNYGRLIQGGVRIYEYVPGFIHEKDVVSDDECAICGTINLDYRSLYIHHENGVFFCNSPVVGEIKKNICDIMEKCEEITYEKWKHRPLIQKLEQWVLHIFSPLF